MSKDDWGNVGNYCILCFIRQALSEEPNYNNTSRTFLFAGQGFYVGRKPGRGFHDTGDEFICEALKSRDYKGLNLKTQVFEDENHMSVVPAMISRMLRVLYGKK